MIAILVLRRKVFLLLMLSGIGQMLYAQQQLIDSLSRLLKNYTKPDTNQVRLLHQLGNSYHLVFPDSTIKISERAYALASSLNDQRGMADALKLIGIGSYILGDDQKASLCNTRALSIYRAIHDIKGESDILNNIAIIHNDKGNFQEALTYYQSSLQLRLQIGDWKGVGGSYNNIANTYTSMGNYTQSLENHFKGLSYREQYGEKQYIANSYANISGVFAYIKRYDEALRYGLKAWQLHREVGNKDGIIHAYISIGDVYFVRGLYDKAERLFKEGLRISNEMEFLSSASVCMTSLGELYVKTGNEEKAEQYFRDVLSIADRSGDIEGAIRSKIGLGKLMEQKNKLSEAVAFLLSAREMALKIGTKETLSESVLYLSKVYERQKDFPKTVTYLREYITYKDSLLNEEVQRKAQEATYQFALQQQQNEIVLLQKDQFIQKASVWRQQLIIVALVLLLLMLVALIIVLYRSRLKEQKANQLIVQQKQEIEEQATKLKELNEMKDKMFSVLSHDLRSPVSSLMGILSLLEKKIISPEDFMSFQQSFSEQLKSLSLLLENLLSWSKSRIEGDTVVYKQHIPLTDKVNEIFNLFNEMAALKQIRLESAVPSDCTVYFDPNHLDIILRNLISNAIKFSHPKEAVKVEVAGRVGYTDMMVTDKGTGISNKEILSGSFIQSIPGTSGEKGVGLGLMLCKEFAEKNGATIQVVSEQGNGSTFILSIPNK